MRNREPETYSNRRGEDKSEEQSRLASEALRRAQGDFPSVGSDVTPQTTIIRDRPAAIRTNDASGYENTATSTPPTNFGEGPYAGLSWGSGQPYGPNLGELARTAGVGPAESAVVDPTPINFGVPLRPAPLCTESHTGRHMNTEEILKRGGR